MDEQIVDIYDSKAVLRKDELQRLLSFLDTLSEEPNKGLDVTDFCKPIDPGIAQCVADHWWEMLDNKDLDKSLEEAANMMYPPGINDNLRNTFIAGAEWQKGQDNIISRQAEVEIIKTQQMCYEKGQADMKRQMMKEAVEGQIYGSDGSHWIETDIDKNIKGKEGDNVRIIVCKNEEE